MLVIGNDLPHECRNADRSKLSCQVKRSRVLELRSQQLGANRNDFRRKGHFFRVGPTGRALVGTPPFNSSRFALPTAASLMAFGRSPHAYRTAHGAGFQPVASACFLKWAAVIIGSVRYVGSSSVDVSTRYVSPLDSLTRSSYS